MTKFAIIIAIENYSEGPLSPFSKIDFAISDAHSLKKVFTEQLGIEERNTVFLTNEKAERENILKEMSALFKKISKEDECFFYYVGHGFNSQSKNRITCWDTDNTNLLETSLSLEEILFNPLRDSECKKSFNFIDSSAEEVKSKNKLNKEAKNLSEFEYSELVKSGPHSFFLSCYPGERSFSTIQNKHGIWALFLMNALNGKADDAIDKNNRITNDSLSRYLAKNIPPYITKSMNINGRQSPYGIYDLENTFSLLEFESEDDGVNKKSVEILFDQYRLSRSQSIPYKNLKSFNKLRHKVPKDYNSFASKLAAELAEDEFLKSEIETIFDRSRKSLRLKNSNTLKNPEGGFLHSEFFRYNISASQSDSDCSEVLISRELELRVPVNEFPIPIDEIFTEGFDAILFPIKGQLDVDSIEDALYDLEDDNQGTFEHKDNLFYFFPKNINGILKVEISKTLLKIQFSSSQSSVLEILNGTEQTLVVMAATLKNLLC